MPEADLHHHVTELLAESGVSERHVDSLAAQLVWRVGRSGDDGPVTVRVGLATSAQQFADLPRLKSATDGELEQAARDRDLRIEWVGPLPASPRGRE